ncbi:MULTISPECIES: apolipoprotein N-acyltransferase [unclassified Roseitalea]|uniref:apolipoprotein N-acyltransferase n=1 Tax=unclassified Roseitalea TaxID=2639107 RepID=UPI00273E70E4|nr:MULTISPECIES: apolipoprotein N-acyltransferase [unclassified Roseitalea]
MERLAQRILLLTGWRRAGLAIGLGAVSALAQAPFHLFIVLFATFPALVWLLDGAVPEGTGRAWLAWLPAFATGWLFGLGYFTAGLWWISNALLVEAPEFAWAIPLAVLGLPAILAVFYGAACALAWLFWSGGVTRIFALAAAFGLAEWARGFVLTGFPWHTLGYAIMPVPVMMQSVALGGIFAMSAFAVLVFALPAQFAAGRRAGNVASALSLVLLGAHIGFGAWRLAQAPEPDAADGPVLRLVQPAISQERKMDEASRQEDFRLLLDLTALPPGHDAQAPDIVIWPETSVPFILTREPGALSAIGEALGEEQALLAGAIREEPAEAGGNRFYNSVMAISAEGVIDAASDKVHLVPFGEYLPLAGWLEGIGLRAVAAADRGYSAAPGRALITLAGGFTVLPLICYEAIFPRLVAAPAIADVDVIVNVTNDAWFGRTPGPWQHLHKARLRPVETGLPMVRVANNGISAVVDPYGRFVARIDIDSRGVTDVTLPSGIQPMLTSAQRKYTFWLFLAVLSAIAVIGSLRRRRFGRIHRPDD